MSKPLFAAFSIGLLGIACITASQAPKSGPVPSEFSVLEFHARNCQKCHGEEGELRSPGWADSKTQEQLRAVLSQMVTEQAGHAPLSQPQMEVLEAFHRAANKAEPWANLLSISGRTMVFETTRDARLSASSAGKKVQISKTPVQLADLGTKLARWTIVLPQSAKLDQLVITAARGEGKSKKVATWKLSESSYSNAKPGMK